jgi:TP901 family phage tail tape measure protein
MAEVAKGIIDIEINTGRAASQLQALQTQINAFNLALNKGNKAQGTFAAEYSRELQSAINKTGLFTAETIRLQTAAATLDKTLSKGKTSLGQFFSAKFNKDSAIAAETMALASERARRLQTQFIATSGAANGFQDALAIRPLAAFSSEAAVAAQKTQILSSMFKQGTTQLINFGKNVQWAGRQLMVGFTVPLTIFGSIAGKTFMDLEKQVVGFKKVYGDLFTTPAELNENLEAVKGLAAEYTKYGIAVKDTIGLAAQAAAAGRQGAELADSVTQSTRLATLGQMDQNAALETTISLQSAFKLSGQDLADTINFLNMVENQTVVSLQDIAAAIPRVAPVISGLGGDVKDLTVFLAAMQEGGVDAAEGANALKSGLASLINPTKQATAMLSGMGINLETIIQANKGDLMGTVQSFAQALGALDQFSRQQALEQVFGKFQYAKLGALFENITREGSQAQQVIATLGYTTEQLASTADKELKTIEESFGVQLTGAVERFKLAIAPIGELFVRLAIPLVNFATTIAEGFNGLSDTQKRFAAIAAVIVGVVIPAVTMMTGLFLNLIGTLAKIGQGIALFGKGFITGGPVGAVKALTQSSKYLSLAEMDAAMAAQQLAGASDAVNAALLQQVGSAGAAQSAIGKLTAAYRDLIVAQNAAGTSPTFRVAGAAQENVGKGKNPGRKGPTIRRAFGGSIPGQGNQDTVPAMLTPGEFVVNKEAASQNLGLLRAINGGKTQQLNKGGMAGVQYFSEGDMVQKAIDRIRNSQNPELALKFNLEDEDYTEDQKRKIRKAFGIEDPSQKEKIQGKDKDKKSKSKKPKTNEEKRSASKKKSTFAHMQRNLVGGKDAMISGEEATKIFDEIARTGDLTPLEKAYAKALKPSGYAGSRITGNLGFDISSYLNSGVNDVDDLINDLEWRRKDGNDPYKRMLLAAGVPEQDIPKVSNDVHKRVTMRLKAMKMAGITTFRDVDLYPHMEKVVPMAIKRAGYANAAGRLFAMSDVSDAKAIRWGGMSQAVVEAAKKIGMDLESGKITKTAKYFNLKGLTEGTKGVSTRGTSSTKIKAAGYAGPLLSLLQLVGSGIKRNSGGPIPGSGNTDTVPAMLTPGEFVVNKEATSQNRKLLEMINGGEVQYLNEGEFVEEQKGRTYSAKKSPTTPEVGNQGRRQKIASRAKGLAKGVGVSSLVGMGIGQAVGGQTGAMVGSFALPMLMPMISKAAGPLIASLNISAAAFTGIAAPLALAGFAIYKLNKQVSDAEKSGAEFTNAMYGSAKTIEGIAKQFGNQTNAQKARIAAVERAGGQEIGEEAQAKSAEFVQSDAGKQMLKDVATVKAGGGNAVEALRNQLSSAIVAGAIGTEEARAIAAEVGTALGDQSIAVGVSGELTKLMGPNGEDMLKNLSSITAEISPKINVTKLASDATSAYEKINVGAKFIQAFQGGEEQFIKNFKINEVSATTSAAFAKEAEARELLNLAYQEGTITLEEYLKQSSAISKSSKENQNTAAQSLGFSDQAALATAAEGKAFTPGARGGMATVRTEEQKIAFAAIKGQRDEIESQLQEYPEMQGEALEKMMANVDKLGGGLFGELLNGTISFDEIPLTIRLQEDGLSEEEIVSLHQNLNILQTIPNIDMVVDIDNPDPAEVQSLIDEYKTFEKLSDVDKKIYVEQNVSPEDLSKFKTSYEEIMKLPDNEIVNVTKMIELDLKMQVDLKAAAAIGDIETSRILKPIAENAQNYVKSVLDAINKPLGGDGSSGSTSGGGSKEKDKLAELLKMLMERFRLQEMLIDKEAEGFNNRVKQLNREIELEERQVSLRQKGLDQLAKKEEAVNDAYNLRVEALDKVSESNSRITEQEKSRISLASALASGDIAAAAGIAGDMQQQSAQYQIEDARAALEKQRQTDLESLTVSINGKLMTRKGIEFEIEQIQDRIYNKGIEIQGIQDTLIGFENRKLDIAKEREKVETRMFLMAQKQAILDLTKESKKNKGKGLTAEQNKELAEYKNSYNTFAKFIGMEQLKNYGGSIAKMAYGGVAYKGSTEAPPALRMNYGSTVPGIGMTDKVPALLTPGEFVVRKPVAKKYGGFLNQLNSQVFPAVGKGISSPTYSMPAQSVTNVPVNNTNVVSTSSPMYNSTYNVNVNVSGTNASPDDIANVVMAKLSNQNRGNLRSSRY